MIRLALASLVLALAGLGCAADPVASCNSLCTDAGFDSGTANVEAAETNCFCVGTTGTVLADDCTAMCTSLGNTTGDVFTSGTGADDNACQCHD